MSKWTIPITDPSNSIPLSVLIVIGEKHFQIIVSQILVAINNEIPEPSPYPFYNNSSNMITTIPAKVNYKMIKSAFPAPILSISP